MIRWLKRKTIQPQEPAPEDQSSDRPDDLPPDDPMPDDSIPDDSINDQEDKGTKSTSLVRRLKNRLFNTRKALSNGLDRILAGKKSLDDDVLEDLEELLITSDIGVQTAMALIERISADRNNITDSHQLKKALRQEILTLVKLPPVIEESAVDGPRVIMVVGVNGVGKTTTIGKLAAKFSATGKNVLIAAADTFRAAAVEQLVIWAERAGSEIVKHKDKADPSAVVYDSLEAALARRSDIVMIDTAGRLHTKVNLMEELKKIKRTAAKKLPGAPHEILLVLDATTGQNAFNQAKLFNDALGVTGTALTKLDGTAKGGIVVNVCSGLNIPLKYIGIGESIEDLHEFDPEAFVDALF